MFVKAEDMAKEVRVNMKGGPGEVTMYTMPDGKPDGVRLVGKISIPEGAGIGRHVHENETEIFYFISGEGEADNNGEIITVKPGDVLTTGGGAAHAVRNIGKGPLEMVAVIVLDR